MTSDWREWRTVAEEIAAAIDAGVVDDATRDALAAALMAHQITLAEVVDVLWAGRRSGDDVTVHRMTCRYCGDRFTLYHAMRLGCDIGCTLTVCPTCLDNDPDNDE